MKMKTQKQNLNELKKELFKGLEGKVKITNKTPETITFTRKMNFGAARIYFKYSFKDKAINQIYTNKNKIKKIIYDRNQNTGLQELNKYFENRK